MNFLLTTILWIRLRTHRKECDHATCSQECKWACVNYTYVLEENTALWITYLAYGFLAKIFFYVFTYLEKQKFKHYPNKFLFISCFSITKVFSPQKLKASVFSFILSDYKAYVYWIKTIKIPMMHIITWSDQHNICIECLVSSICNKQYIIKPKSEKLQKYYRKIIPTRKRLSPHSHC